MLWVTRLQWGAGLPTVKGYFFVTDYRLILRLLLRGYSYRDIQFQASCSHASIAKAAEVAKKRHLTSAYDVEGIPDEEISSWFVDGRRSVSEDYVTPDFASIIHARRYQAKKTLKQLWLDYCATDAPAGMRHCGFDRFRELINSYIDAHELAATMTYTPGHTMQVDWASTKLELVDASTGATVRLDVFVALLPYSGMITASAHHNQKMAAWLDAHRQAFEYFSGVTSVIFPDNASTASNRIDSRGPARQVNPTYQEFLSYYDTAAAPTRARKPRDKGGVEAGAKIITRDVISVLTGTAFVDLDDVTSRMDQLVDEINDRVPFRRRDVSRRQIFNQDEADALHQLPATPFTQVRWIDRIVARDFHIEVDKVKYSLPYTYACQPVKSESSAAH